MRPAIAKPLGGEVPIPAAHRACMEEILEAQGVPAGTIRLGTRGGALTPIGKPAVFAARAEDA